MHVPDAFNRLPARRAPTGAKGGGPGNANHVMLRVAGMLGSAKVCSKA